RGPAGRLDLLMRAPVDIFYEIVSHLHPLDLINVARTSKPLRTLLMTRKSRSVWRSCLGNVRGLPPCPDEMNEPAYAALLFERICTV
ncbi:uncharacterized protein TRAVEDRAFT_90169, partial [Trametes versicolor FP-101664 SS1]|uniref:uncharacterized protein n=1 Tax=Trametes versicolor (strain FP-101664) TaxID=717944 RepID=UPI0004622F9E